MAKGSGNIRGRTSDASKPYDVSNSFVKRVASRVTELLPQPSWLSRWMSPSSLPNANDFASHSLSSTITSRPPATSRADLNMIESVDNHIPAKKARTSVYSSPANQNKFLKNLHGAEDLSPITVRGEPVAGPSCRSDGPDMVSSTPAQPQNSNKVNGDDCSETSESTSGCSSLVPQAQSTIRSLGGSRYGRIQPPTINSTNSFQRRGPSFSTTTFSSPLRTSMRERLGSSPFYSGRTMYGGSSQAYLTTAMHSPHRRVGPTVKPAPAQQSLPLSSTAKRILDALEQFSTPVMDAKRMPVVGSKRKLDGSQRYSELSIPTTPDLLRVKRRERLQLSTSAARHTARSAPSPPSPTEYTIRKEEEESNRKKQTGKVKTKEKVEEEPGVVVKLPPAVLTVDNLPKIDIAIPPPPPPVEVAALNATSTHVPISTKFRFATPTVVPHCGNLVLTSSMKTSSFKFSAPICESTSSSVLDSNSSKSVLSCSLPRTFSDNLIGQSTKQKSEDDSSSENSNSLNSEKSLLKPSSTTPVRPGTEGKECKSCQRTGSLSIPCTCHKTQSKMTTNDKTVSTTSKFICPTCKNDKSSNSASCTFCQSKPSDTNKNHVKSPATGFGNLFKKPVGTWECSTCMIQNKNDATKCIACESAKPTQKTTITCTNTTPAVVTSATITSGFGNQFQKPSGSWECDTCLVVNKQNSVKCISCESPKPGAKLNEFSKSEPSSTVKLTGSGFGNMFKKAPGSWSCEVCMISNSADKVKCVACETVKPGATLPKTSESSVPKFSFGIPSSSSDMNTNFNFGIPKGEQSSSSVINLPVSTSSTAVTQSAIISDTFSFGIPKISSASTSGAAHNFAQKMLSTEASESKLLAVNIKKVVSTSSVESSKSELSSLTNAVSTTVPTTNITTVKTSFPTFGVKNLKSEPSEEKTTNSTQIFQFGTNKVAQNSNKPIGINLTSNSKSSPDFLFGTNQGNLGSNVASSTTNTISSSSASNIFKFGDTKTVSSGAGVSSISSVNTQPSFTTPKPANVFSFGSNSEAKVAFGTNASTEDQQNNKGSINPTEIKPTFVSFTAPQSQAPVFGSTNNAFGSKDQLQNPFTLSSPNIFGTTESKNSSTTNSFPAFGQSNTFQAASQENKPSAVYSFGSVPAKDPPASGGFVFNPTTEKQAESTVTAIFGFNNSTSASSTTFNFEPKPFPASISPFPSESAAPVFGTTGSQQPATAFGGQTNSTPVFAFGSQSAQPPQTPTNTVFEFASNQQQQNAPVAAASSTTFVFGATPATPAQAPAAPAFDPNIKPTFNFSQGSTPVFSAIPTINSTGPTPPVTRKIRKAVRRTNVPSVRQT